MLFCHVSVLFCHLLCPAGGYRVKNVNMTKAGTSVSLFVSVTVTVSVTWLCWSLAHAEQLLFSCVNSKVCICNYVTWHMSHFAFHMSHVICEMLMLILGKCWTTFVFMSMLKSEYLYIAHVICQMLMLILGTCWTTFVFMSTLKCCFLWVKMSTSQPQHHPPL